LPVVSTSVGTSDEAVELAVAIEVTFGRTVRPSGLSS
jgi:hypothetical protein